MTLTVTPQQTGATSWWMIAGKDCEISLERRPAYCDRGNFVAKIFPRGTLALEIDAHDGWPRYYFDLGRALAEIEAWLVKRGQMPVEFGLEFGQVADRLVKEHRETLEKLGDG